MAPRSGSANNRNKEDRIDIGVIPFGNRFPWTTLLSPLKNNIVHGVSETLWNILQNVNISINRTPRIVKLPFSPKRKRLPFSWISEKRSLIFVFSESDVFCRSSNVFWSSCQAQTQGMSLKPGRCRSAVHWSGRNLPEYRILGKDQAHRSLKAWLLQLR